MSSKPQVTKDGNFMIKDQFRNSLYILAANLIDQFTGKGNLLVNLFGIDGMGKSNFIFHVLPKVLKKNRVKYKTLSISPKSNVSELAIDLLKWGYADLLKTNQKINVSGLRNNISGIENSFVELSAEIRNHKKRSSFALLIDGLDKLPIDDLDWFQSTVIEAFNSLSNSFIVITSHNELSWHTWEFKELCKRIPVSGFSSEDISDICPSIALAERIFHLSSGHPATVEALLKIANQKYRNFSVIGSTELDSLDNQLLKELKLQVDKNISSRTRFAWLREVFWLAAVADKFDGDLLGELARGSGIKIPDDVADIAWEIAYIGLATWDSKSETYKMPTEMRGRILQYYLNAEKSKYAKTLKDIARYYQSRSRVSSYDTKEQISIANDYLTRYHKFQLTPSKNKANNLSKKNKRVTSSPSMRGGKMKKSHIAGTQKIYVSRKSAEDTFKKLINGELKNKWILGIQGEAGIGKSYLVRKYKEIAETEKYSVVVLDLNFAKNRQREVFLNEIVAQTQLKSSGVKKSMAPLTSKKGGKDVYMGIESTETFDYYTTKAAATIAAELKMLVVRNKRPIVIIDTFDDSPGINQLASWLFEEVLSQFREAIYLVVAGRKSLLEVIKGDLVKDVKLMELDRLANSDINEIAKRWKEMGKTLINKQLIATVERISNGNPLIASWVLFYASEINNLGDIQWLVNVSDKTKALRKIADFILGKNRTTKLEHSTFKGLQAAIHFGSNFNLDLFKATVPVRSLGKKSHNEVFNHIASYFYVREAVDNWTLHDQIREWMRAASKSDKNLPEFIELSQNAIRNYYDPRIKKLEGKKNKSIEDQAVLDNLRAQRLSNLLYILSKPSVQAADYHLEIWNHLDSLWHRYRLEQMAQVIQYGRDVQAWKPFAEGDTLLTNLLDAAQAWAYFSQANYSQAKLYAEKIINDKNAPRRLSSTAKVIIGLLPSQKPQDAIENYLEPAKNTYLQMVKELVSDKLPNGEFTDKKTDIYLEIHQVLMSIGGMHLLHLYDLDKGKEALQEAFVLAQDHLDLPLYAATALNELARILRFEGNFNDALNKVTLAITIYKKEMENPEIDVNFGYFYETLGLIYKEQDQFTMAKENLNKALQIYNNIQGPMELRKATIWLELGHVHMLLGEMNEAEELLFKSNKVFKIQLEEHPWYYLNSIEKLGEYYIEKSDLKNARKCFEEQEKLAIKFGHDLWEYWAIQHLASIDFEQNHKVDVNKLARVLNEFDQKRNRQFGPAFWRTKLLFYKIAKKDNNIALALKQLTEGLMYLAEKWKPLFSHNFGILRSELLQLQHNELKSEANYLRKLWKAKFSKVDPTPEFIKLLDELITQLK